MSSTPVTPCPVADCPVQYRPAGCGWMLNGRGPCGNPHWRDEWQTAVEPLARLLELLLGVNGHKRKESE